MNHIILKVFTIFLITLTTIYPQSFSTVEWFTLGSGMSTTVKAVAVNGNDVYVGGLFSFAGGTPANRIARWNGNNWSSLGSGVNGAVHAIAVIGTDIYVAGSFTQAGGILANNIAKWNGSSWSALGDGVNDLILTLTVSGAELYAGGFFTQAGGTASNRIAKWDGTSWSALGEGINNEVNAIAVEGNNVYAGGYFSVAGRENVNSIAKWDGTTWTQMGSGINGIVRTIIVKDGNVYAGGIFETAGGNSANRIARWEGNSWSALSTGLNGSVFSMTAFGNDIYVGGMFTSAGGIPANRIAKYNVVNETWSALGSGLSGSVDAMTVQTNTGSMIIGGAFGQTVSGMTMNYVGRFTDSDNPLPVELVSFNAVSNNNTVVLNWQTNSENNNHGFEILRKRSEAANLESEWSIIGFVDGIGTTTTTQSYSFIDENISSGTQGLTAGRYLYRLKQIDYNGNYHFSDIVEVEIKLPNTFSLEQNYPNPFNPSTKIRYTVASNVNGEMSKVVLKVYNVLGNEVATLVNKEQSAGNYEIEFNAAGLSSGIYFVRMEAPAFLSTLKTTLLK